MTTQAEKGAVFRALHERDRAFIIPNPWDVGSAKILEHMGFEALATTSMGYAFSIGKRDTAVGRDAMLEHIATMARATSLPVSADLENGYGDDPQTVAETIRLAADAGVVGGSIEDATGRADDPIYRIEAAVDRVRAAVDAARSLPFPFTLTARAENYLHGRPDLADTIARLKAYEAAGADVLYAPGLKSEADIAAVVEALERPINVLMGLQGVVLSVDRVSALGARRISVGSALYRAAMGALLRAANEMRNDGTFTFAADAANPRDIAKMLTEGLPSRPLI